MKKTKNQETRKSLVGEIEKDLKKAKKPSLKFVKGFLQMEKIVESNQQLKEVFGRGDFKGFSINGKKYKLSPSCIHDFVRVADLGLSSDKRICRNCGEVR